MAAGVNKAILVGHLGADPELRNTASGTAVCEFRVATSESWKDKNGQKQERTEWHRVVVWGKTAEICAKYLAKGRQVFIEGRIQTRSWEDKEGQKRWSTEIVAREIRFVGGRGTGAPGAGGASGGQGFERGGDEMPASVGADDFSEFSGSGGDDSDIPF